MRYARFLFAARLPLFCDKIRPNRRMQQGLHPRAVAPVSEGQLEATEPPPHPRQPDRPTPRRCSRRWPFVGKRQERGVTVRMLPTQLPTKVLRCERFRAYSGGGRWTPKTAETRIVACDAGSGWRRADSGGLPRKGGKMVSEYTRQELNLRPTDSKSGALSN